MLGSPDGRGFRERVRAAAPAGTLRFGYITDAHCEEGPDPAGYGASSLAQLAHFSREAQACGAEFLVCGGDLCNGNRPKRQTVREIRAAGEALRSGGLPVCFTIGNHDDNTYFCRDHGGSPEEGLTAREWYRLAEGAVPFPGAHFASATPGCGYIDLPAYRMRLLLLNTVDLPFVARADGRLRYFTINDHAISQAQLEFVRDSALDFTGLPESESWALAVFSHMRFGYLANGAAMTGLLTAFRRGGCFETTGEESYPTPFRFAGSSCFPSPAEPADLAIRIRADFSRQGPREIIAHFYGHEHLDEIRRAPGGWPEISFLNALCYQNAPERPERTFGSPSEEAWSIVDVDRAHRSISIFRSGAGNDFSTDF